MKQSFKIVTVYTGYSEYSVCRIDEIDADNIHEACVLVQENNQEELLEDGVDQQHIDEFHTGHRELKDGVCMVHHGSEHVQLVIVDSHPLYQQVDHPTSSWTDDQWTWWVDMLESGVVTA